MYFSNVLDDSDLLPDGAEVVVPYHFSKEELMEAEHTLIQQEATRLEERARVLERQLGHETLEVCDDLAE